jgi:hypothetical protein
MPDFVSEPITPLRGAVDTGAMARGEPGLPRGFTWRDAEYVIAERVSQWKQSSREGSSAQGQLYLRRHYYQLRMSDGKVWTVYCTRQTPAGSSSKQRWFLYEIA